MVSLEGNNHRARARPRMFSRFTVLTERSNLHTCTARALIGSPMGGGFPQRRISLTESQWQVFASSSIMSCNYWALKMIDFNVVCLKGHTAEGSRRHCHLDANVSELAVFHTHIHTSLPWEVRLGKAETKRCMRNKIPSHFLFPCVAAYEADIAVKIQTACSPGTGVSASLAKIHTASLSRP